MGTRRLFPEPYVIVSHHTALHLRLTSGTKTSPKMSRSSEAIMFGAHPLSRLHKKNKRKRSFINAANIVCGVSSHNLA
jgi:hypothetical protein